MVDELGKRSLNGRLQPFDVSLRHRRMSTIALDRLALSALTLLALGVRFWQLGQKGLWLGEAANALAARASVGEIIQHTWHARSEEHTSELQSHSFISYAVFCLKKKNNKLM